MRVSDQYRFLLTQRNVSQATERLLKIQQEVATGKKINVASDDPVVYGILQDVRRISDNISQFERNISTAITRLQTADSTMDELNNVLIKAKEVAIGAMNVTMTADMRTTAAKEVRGYMKTFHNLANRKEGGRYLFSGTRSTTPALDDNGVYQGRDDDVYIEVGVEWSRNIAIAGKEILSPDDGVDSYTVLVDLINALESDDVTQIGESLELLDSAMDQISNVRASVGTIHDQLMVDESLMAQLSIDMSINDAELSELDLAGSISTMVRLENAFQGALTVAKRSFSLSLLDL